MIWPHPRTASSLRPHQARAGFHLPPPAAFILLLSICLGLPLTADAQSRPTATRAGDLQLGGGLVFARSNYNFNPMTLIGGTGYVCFDPKTHYGGEFNFHNLTSSQDSTVYERTYEVGPRVDLVHGATVPYAKFLYGRGVYNFSNNIANVAYNIYTVGGGADFRVLPSMNIRADYEYQTWPGFPLKTLHPSVITIGVAFHFHQ